MKLYIILFFCLSSISCTTIGHVDTEKKIIILKGYGAKSFSWEKDGEKYSISRDEPVAFPDSIPIVK